MQTSTIDSEIKFSSRSNTAKRIFDLVCTIPGLIILSPFFLLIAICMKLTDRGPVFFSQERIGYKGEQFRILKFRTMVVDADKKGGQLTVGKDPRITRVGSLLRKTKLDELPQLINVLKGEMSLVGPRPEVPKYVNLYTAQQQKVLDLMPGITDPASIEYRNENEILSRAADPESVYKKEIMPEKIRLNLDYGKEASVMTDIYIIFKTIGKILK